MKLYLNSRKVSPRCQITSGRTKCLREIRAETIFRELGHQCPKRMLTEVTMPSTIFRTSGLPRRVFVCPSNSGFGTCMDTILLLLCKCGQGMLTGHHIPVGYYRYVIRVNKRPTPSKSGRFCPPFQKRVYQPSK